MKQSAVFIHGVRDVRLGAFDPGVAGDGFVSVEIAAVGICGSDLHYYKDGGIGSATICAPFVPGHEFSARLLQDIESKGLVRGQLVAVDPAQPCHGCEWCHAGHHNLCPRVRFIGAPPYHGALTQCLPVPVEQVLAVPDSLTAAQVAMLEPLGVCVHALDLARPRLIESVAVLGCGAIGLGIVQLLALMGIQRLVAVDPLPHRSAAAGMQGAAEVGDTVQAVLDATGGRGCDLVIEATNSPLGFRDAIAAAAIGARVVLVGIPDGDRYELSAAEPRRRGLNVAFSRRMGNVYPRAIELAAACLVDLNAMTSHHIELEQTPEAFALQADNEPGLIKTLVYPNGVPAPRLAVL